MSNEQDFGKFVKATVDIIREKLSQRSVGSDNFSDVDLTSDTYVRDFSLSNIHKLMYQIVGESIIRSQLESGILSPTLLDKIPQDYEKAIQAAIYRRTLSDMAREWDKFTNANLNSLSPEVQQKLLNYRQTLQKGMDEAGDILSDYITRNPHLKKVWEGQDNDKILNQL